MMLLGSVVFTVGLLLVIFNKYFGTAAVRTQNQFWRFNFGEREILISRAVGIVVGLLLIVIGVLIVLGVIRMR